MTKELTDYEKGLHDCRDEYNEGVPLQALVAELDNLTDNDYASGWEQATFEIEHNELMHSVRYR